MTSPRFSQQFWSHGPTQHNADSAAQRLAAHESSTAETTLTAESAITTGAFTKARRPARPCSVFVPENYEPNYAYPLIVWLHETGRSERDIARVLPQISMRNYLGLSLRGTAVSNGGAAGDSVGYGWSRSQRASALLEDELQTSVRCLREEYHVNTERIFLAGAGDGGTAAWELFVAHPEWFAGLAALGGEFPWNRRPLRRFHDLHGKHVLLGVNGASVVERRRTEQAGRLLFSAGLAVSLRSHLPGRHVSQPMLRHVDNWIMEAIGGCL